MGTRAMLDNWQWMLVYPAIVLALIEMVWIVSRSRPGFGRRTAIVTTLTVRVVYLAWRVLFTIPTDAWWNTLTGVALLAVEIIGFAQSVTVYVTPEQTVDLVRLITESPDWVRGDEEDKPWLAAAGWRAVRGAARPTLPSRRSQVRMASGATAILGPVTAFEGGPALERAREGDAEFVQVDDRRAPRSSVGPDSEALTAVVEDIGFGGCRLTLRHRLEPGTPVIIKIPDLAQPDVAQVRWCKRRGLHYEAGLQFDRAHHAG